MECGQLTREFNSSQKKSMDAFFEIQITCHYNYVIFIECIFLNNVLCSNNVMEGKRLSSDVSL